jgi:hypothetical protein
VGSAKVAQYCHVKKTEMTLDALVVSAAYDLIVSAIGEFA